MRILGNYQTRKIVGEVNNEPSLTQPDQTLSIPELLRRHLNGIPATGVESLFTADEEGFDPYENLQGISDPTELEDLATDLRGRLVDLHDRVESENKEYKERIDREAKEKDEQIFAAIQTRLQRE